MLFSSVESVTILVVIGGVFLVLSGVLQLVQAFIFCRGRQATLDTA